MTDKTSVGQSTLSIWGGELEHELYERSTQVPVVHSVSFTYKDIDTWQDVALEKVPGHIYSRNTNPTVRAFEDKVKELEAAEAELAGFSEALAMVDRSRAASQAECERLVGRVDAIDDAADDQATVDVAPVDACAACEVNVRYHIVLNRIIAIILTHEY